jgi:drug/metabolite transporter (DMT)-like permease
MQWFLWLRIASLRIGTLTGIYLSCVFVAWLIVANRAPALVPFAETRNLVAGATLVIVLAIPVLRFRHQPGKLFVAGLMAWTLLTITYLAAEMHFTLLESRMGAFHVFMLGAVSYGFVAVLDWVFLMCAGVRHEHMVHSRETAVSTGRRRTH